MKRSLPWLSLVALLACGDDDTPTEPAAPPEPTLSVARHESCLPAALEGAEVLDAPRLVAEAEMDELRANYALGDALVRVNVFLYGAAEAERERAVEEAMLEACGGRAECQEHRIGGHRARLVDLGIAGQESTLLFVEPGIRVSVLAPLERSAEFAELLDLECLQRLHDERRGD